MLGCDWGGGDKIRQSAISGDLVRVLFYLIDFRNQMIFTLGVVLSGWILNSTRCPP